MAHRGDSARFAENTRAAYVGAVQAGADGIECDVRFTRDRQLVCLHDPTVDRTSNGHGPVEHHTLAELRSLDWSSWHPGDIATLPSSAVGPQILTLPEMIEVVLAELGSGDRPFDLAIETKHPSPFGHLVEDDVVRILDAFRATGQLNRLAIRIITFSRAAAAHLHEIGAPYHVELLVDEIDEDALSGRLPAGVRTLAPAIGALRAHPDVVQTLGRRGYDVHPWTVDDIDDARFAQDLGVSIITTNRPGPIRAALG
nr:glycerophosphodiester phosphodiesterase family protein [Luteimicrobium album]